MLFYCTVNFLHIESKRNFILPVVFKVFSVWAVNIKVYNYWLGSRTTAVLFDPKTDMLPEVAGWGQQICLRVKQNCCCLRSQFETVFLYTFIFSKFSYSVFPFAYQLDVFNILVHKSKIWTMLWHCDVNITLLIEPMKIRPSINSSIEGNNISDYYNVWIYKYSIWLTLFLC